jgi:hypothetical protein
MASRERKWRISSMAYLQYEFNSNLSQKVSLF